ncbi:N-alpha-acetyltransferase, non-catalitic subunit [Ceratocystis pirilliformis]|uniref:N-alpha-acetyltransferase, non-catalitic subunit n=1 Tax=Ceratocystis pirilliformis TaxID=259994 RepID=A0ABR3YN28_9PEZI
MTFDMATMGSSLPSWMYPSSQAPASGLVYTDVTAAFRRAVADMKPGEIIKDDNFSLFDSVAALEIMDPKMDINCADAQTKPEPEYDLSRDLTPQQVLGIIDQLISQEMAWHTGYPLSLTLFSSHYIDQLLSTVPSKVQTAQFSFKLPWNKFTPVSALRAYCIGLIKTCDMVNDQINQEHYYEEEDFVTNTYKRSLFSHFSVESVTQELIDAHKSLSQGACDINPELTAALCARLHFRASFITALENTQHRLYPSLIEQAWTKALKDVEDVIATRHLGEPVPEAFSAKLQQKLSSSMPPRPIVDIGHELGFRLLKQLFEDGLKVTDVLDYKDPITVQNFVVHFQAKKPTPLVITRTILQRYLFKDLVVLGNASLRLLMDDDLTILVKPPAVLLDPINDYVENSSDVRHRIAQKMEAFRVRAAQCYLDIYRSLCQNRCRVRRTLYHVVRDWDLLEINAIEFDSCLHTLVTQPETFGLSQEPLADWNCTVYTADWQPLTLWSRLHKLKVMLYIVELGFELDVYYKHEMAAMYFYLSTLCEEVQALETSIQNYSAAATAATTTSALDTVLKGQQHESLMQTETLRFTLKHGMASALFSIFTVLQRMNAIEIPKQPCGTDELRYDLRMRPFAIKSRPLQTYTEFQALLTGTSSGSTPPPLEELLDCATSAINKAQTNLAGLQALIGKGTFAHGSLQLQTDHLKKVERATKASAETIKVLRKAIQCDKKVQVTIPVPDDIYAGLWVVPQVKLSE